MNEFDEKAVLQTEHLILRYLEEGDREAIFNNINHDEEVLKYYVVAYAENLEDFSLTSLIDRFKENEMYIFAIVLKESNEVIGNILQCNKPNSYMHTVEVVYALGRKYWNKGYMSEALQAMIAFLFEKGVHKVVACHMTDNATSGRVMEKCSMKYEGRKIDDIFYHDRYYDTLNYYIINEGEDNGTLPGYEVR